MRKQSRQIPVLTIFMCLLYSLSFAQTDFQRDDTKIAKGKIVGVINMVFIQSKKTCSSRSRRYPLCHPHKICP